jgi:hypothetical protein
LQNNIERSMQELVAMAEDMKLYDWPGSLWKAYLREPR